MQLLEAGADVNAMLNRPEPPAWHAGETPLELAINRGVKGRTIALLLVNRRGGNASTAGLPLAHLQTLMNWQTEKVDQLEMKVEEAERVFANLVSSIPEWCARAASEAGSQRLEKGKKRKNLD
jgi:hypothetical protein